MVDEGIRTTAEIGDIDRIEPRVILDDLSRSQDPLPVSPVHLFNLFGGWHRFYWKKIHGDGKDSQIPQFFWNLQVDSGIARIVGPSYNNHHLVIRSNPIQCLLPAIEQGLIKSGLESLGLLIGFLDALRFAAEGPPKIDQFLLQIVPSLAEVKDRLKNLRMGSLEIDGRRDGIGEGLGIRTC